MDRRCNDVPPVRLAARYRLAEVRIEQQVLEVRAARKRLLDSFQEHGANDAAAAPHESDVAEVEIPARLLGSRTHLSEPLSVRTDLRRIQRIAGLIDELGAIAHERFL